MKYMIEFELPDNDTVLREIETADVAWGIWGYSGCTKAKPVQRWIPCSERCPDKSEWYLVTEEWDDGFAFVTRDRYVVGEGWTYAVFGIKCMAWMPLPTPYRGGEQDG